MKSEDAIREKDRPFTGAEYLASLCDGREVYVYGERVDDVTTHPAFRNAARSLARLYDALHDPRTKDLLTAPTDTGSGGFTHKFFRAAHSREELIGQRDAIAHWARMSYGWMGRTPDYKASLIGELHDGKPELWLKVIVAATSLCPCSKSISNYGAHNQRSHITIKARVEGHMWLEELIDIAESEASCEVYGILKRADEKYVTERAYDNPKFVEDIVRDVAVRLNKEERVRAYVVEAENFESIHNHSAYALIEKDKEAG